jgi:hypothetical protein
MNENGQMSHFLFIHKMNKVQRWNLHQNQKSDAKIALSYFEQQVRQPEGKGKGEAILGIQWKTLFDDFKLRTTKWIQKMGKIYSYNKQAMRIPIDSACLKIFLLSFVSFTYKFYYCAQKADI